MNFGAPLILLGLFALPMIWWLLRITPPKPHKEIFPPLRLLIKQTNQQTTTNHTPWWLLLLRLAIAALIIIALARPSWHQNPIILSESQPLALIIDNGWASVEEWKKRIVVAETLLDQAIKQQKDVYFLATAENDPKEIGPLPAEVAKQHLMHLQPQPWPINRLKALNRLIEKTRGQTLDIAYLSDSLQTNEDNQAFTLIEQLKPETFLWYSSDISKLTGIRAIDNHNGNMAARIIRATTQGETPITLSLYDLKSKLLGRFTTNFHEGEAEVLVPLNLPLELRNDISWIKIDNHAHAAATFLVDSRNRINRVALLSPSINEMVQPLLSPLYYVIKALQGHAELITTGGGELSADIDYLLKQNPSVFIMGDIVNMSQEAEKKLSNFVNKGGILIRFAGDNLSSTEQYDSLLPVPLRPGKRLLGSVMSWAKPQKLAPFVQNSFFSNLPFPENVTVSRQILAEPTPDLFEKTWLSLADGSPLITATDQGKGVLIFIHTAPDPTWSNLALSGFFAQMLQKLITLSVYNNTSLTQMRAMAPQNPWRTLNADGQLQSPPFHVVQLTIDEQKLPIPSYYTPPGLYGINNNFYALNLLTPSSRLIKTSLPNSLGKNPLSYETKEQHFTGPLLGLALLLFAFDSFVVLWMGKAFFFNRQRSIFFLLPFIIGLAILFSNISNIYAQTAKTHDEIMVKAAGATHLAYVITNNHEIDTTSKSGLETLSQFIADRTMLSPGSVIALDLDKDELAFYPLIYWPLDANSPMPTQKALEKINAFMKNGGAVLFDTRDQINTNLTLEETATPATQRLRDILSELNIPTLEPASADHVVSRSFYIMPDFPGRYRGSPLWVASSSINKKNKNSMMTGDNVSSLFITANDFAGAWALDPKDTWKYPLVSNDSMQRLWAFRAGLNIVIYVLTGNYKADQIHVPALLERFNKERR
ncbi:hypothetical protein X471_00060 [Bartonella bacilliformis str. Heidi Mejia]|uniref:N-terminal double-transmembrane domain protein n=2 Tax=Bartonella bacilliformis TaxID=774 RepID=A1UTI4_BARBK|nr:DUF4159 domain-containing protein [Bartonella bacilliformis]ABM45482.1 N-terminal double-transmembrane domain protein [Bartonella bacilliformis KC583]AMG86051.1 DUF4159 domain-containing protein [Bartonella bacilliformis]EKS43544.1 hypothetical protein BbINS_04742 [Bartonella bacilliformis INS]EYS89631.1 hypothetical protein X472_00063 [Bartonella bacilliformis San Pedro600-02]EYS92570.1 hypothetical protein X471_00060 [Bartonella bacilliformis str. Heidi Mejia]